MICQGHRRVNGAFGAKVIIPASFCSWLGFFCDGVRRTTIICGPEYSLPLLDKIESGPRSCLLFTQPYVQGRAQTVVDALQAAVDDLDKEECS